MFSLSNNRRKFVEVARPDNVSQRLDDGAQPDDMRQHLYALPSVFQIETGEHRQLQHGRDHNKCHVGSFGIITWKEAGLKKTVG